MLLSDRQILERLVATDESCIFVSPLVNPGSQLGPSSLDVRLGTELISVRTVASTHIDLSAVREELMLQISDYSKRVRIEPSGKFVLHPGEFALAHTLEFVRLPSDIAARLEGRSSFGRMGLQVHATAGFVDPGFEGALTFELMNSGKLPVVLKPGLRLGQLCFFAVDGVEIPYMHKRHSKYGGKLGVEHAKIYEDPEICLQIVGSRSVRNN